MASLWQTVTDSYIDLMDKKSDPRVKDWLMMSTPIPTYIICLTYIYIVKVLGPKFMKNRKPFVLRSAMTYYNIVAILLSSYIFIGCMKYGWWNDYSFRCQPVDYSNNPRAIGMLKISWIFYMSKFMEMLDTIFFVLRKKNNQITVLHVFHHAIVPASCWIGVKYVGGGHSTFLGLLNSFVHIVMYGYYLLAAFGSKIKPFLWWKKYLTTLQIIQFILIIIHAVQPLFIECDFPNEVAWLIIAITFVIFLLFGNFYIKTYMKKQNTKVEYAFVKVKNQ